MGEVRRIAKPFFPWVGGKLFLLPYIFQLLPRRAPRLLEVCGGSGAVTLGLGAGYAPLRVYNDIDADLANLFRCARDRPLALLRELDFLPLHARADFEVVLRFLHHEYDPMDYLEEELQIAEGYFPPMDRQEVKKLLVGRANLPDVQRAAAYYLSIRYSYSATGNSFGGRSVELRRFLGLLRRASDALQGVVVENKDCCDVVRQYVRTGAVIMRTRPIWRRRGCTRPPLPSGITSGSTIACAPRRRGTATSSCPITAIRTFWTSSPRTFILWALTAPTPWLGRRTPGTTSCS